MRTAVSVTVLFTDLADSTALSTRLLADGAEALRRTYFGLLRDAVAGHGGREVKNLDAATAGGYGWAEADARAVLERLS